MTISEISNKIKSLFTLTEKPSPNLPPTILSIGGLFRPGISVTRSVSNIAAELGKHGIPTEPAEDGTENKTMVYTMAIVEEIFRALQEDANIQVAFKPGDINVLTHGVGYEGTPVISNGVNINFPQGTGALQ